MVVILLGILSTSLLDRFLLSEDWCTQRPNMIQRALLCGLSNHCPILLSIYEENCGMCPQRMSKCWSVLSGYS